MTTRQSSKTPISKSGFSRTWWPLALYRVVGDSMLPTYRAGQVLVGWRWFRPRVGRVVVAHGRMLRLVKRIGRIEAAGIWLEGDNTSASSDSRDFGYVDPAQLEAVIIGRLS